MNLFQSLPALSKDLELINYPPFDWRKGIASSQSTYDVVIIGAGMAGLTAGAALFKEGIFNIKICDQSLTRTEGPWVTYARMQTLRSPKDISGPALDIPHLTFRAWYEITFGEEAWQQLGKIPNQIWMDYLTWYREAMQLPVENQCLLTDIIPRQESFELKFQAQKNACIVKALKVVLATGRGGVGGPIIPHFVAPLPKSVYAHTIENINFTDLKNSRIGIIGAGASSFDAGAVALESGAKSVDILMRRSQLPKVNKFASTAYKGFSHGYYKLSDEKRLAFMQACLSEGIPPPIEALRRIKDNPNLRLLGNTFITEVQYDGTEIHLQTNQGNFTFNFLILGTGFHIDGHQQPELRHVINKIALWKDSVPPQIMKEYHRMNHFPYLGPSFEFLPKAPGKAPYLKNLHCFNFGAALSHALLSSDIPAISIGAARLAQGIAADLFNQDNEKYLERLQNYQEEDFRPEDYFPINQR